MPRFDDGDNLHWGGLFGILVRDESVANADLVQRLGDLFREFKEFVDFRSFRRNAQLRIHPRDHAWLLNRGYYKPDISCYAAPSDDRDVPRDVAVINHPNYHPSCKLPR